MTQSSSWSTPATSAAPSGALPFVDEHRIGIPAPRDVVWAALARFAGSSLRLGSRNPLGWLLGTEPREGFEVIEVVPLEHLCLAGRHRFSRYRLSFELDAAGRGTVVRARTYAQFPGVRGRAYRALVLGTGAHTMATRLMLLSLRRAVAGRPEQHARRP